MKSPFGIASKLKIVSKILAAILFLFVLFNSPQVRAQEITCPLPSDIAVTFLNSTCHEVKIKQPKTFYRYYSDNNNKYGRYLTTNQYLNNVDVINKLALNQEWGNKAILAERVTLPAGTTIYRGLVAPVTGRICNYLYPGGGQQIFIQDSRDPNIKWSEGINIFVDSFTCP